MKIHMKELELNEETIDNINPKVMNILTAF